MQQRCRPSFGKRKNHWWWCRWKCKSCSLFILLYFSLGLQSFWALWNQIFFSPHLLCVIVSSLKNKKRVKSRKQPREQGLTKMLKIGSWPPLLQPSSTAAPPWSHGWPAHWACFIEHAVPYPPDPLPLLWNHIKWCVLHHIGMGNYH